MELIVLSVVFPHRFRASTEFTPFLVKSRPYQRFVLWVHEHHHTDGIRNPAGVLRILQEPVRSTC